MLTSFFLELEIFQRKVVEKNKTPYSYSIPFSFSENRAVYETMWTNMIQPDRTQTEIQYGAYTFHAGYLKLETHIQNMYYLRLFHGKSDC